ncbi:CRAL/TRIO domain-containing protein [Artomyces pyxidatus]|uniref:CRAL/TRIO domain-containing protein n=1 Tax=Artomyces pyxidatus TaxID=48021 RepID=A0ACB8T5Q0_9AGAM|nr:CRAL/TRIO domain-containing protein [Artomyces pyxidatus]
MTADEYNQLSGHLGHLTATQSAAFDAFKKNLENAQLYTVDPPSHDDATLLRFLRARRFDPAKAQTQFTTTENWRRENDIKQLYATFPIDEFERAKHFYPRWTGRRDKQGVPVYVYRLASLTGDMVKELHSSPEERRYQRIVALWEFMSRFTLPLCSHLPHIFPHEPTSTDADSHVSPAPICSVTSIIDLQHVSLGTLWTLRGHLQQASELATAHYPETLNMIAVVNAPSFFGTVWGWIKAWFDPATRAKVHVLGSKPGPELLKYIDAQNLPRAYGGELEFEYTDEPVLDEPTRELLGGKMPRGPIVFQDGKPSRPDGFPGEKENDHA